MKYTFGGKYVDGVCFLTLEGVQEFEDQFCSIAPVLLFHPYVELYLTTYTGFIISSVLQVCASLLFDLLTRLCRKISSPEP